MGKRRFRLGLVFALLVLHVCAAYGVYRMVQYGISAPVLVLALIFYCVSSLGITVGYHRYFTHGAFRCFVPVRYALAIAGALAGEGSLDEWCRNHRQHHRFTDEPGDPHSPWTHPNRLIGFFWAHVGWLAWQTEAPPGYHPTHRQEDLAVIQWQQRWYWPLTVSGFVVPWALCGADGLWVAGFVRLVLHLHVTWCVNSVCHLWGTRPRSLDGGEYALDQSRNNAIIAVLGMGEGWHGNHHVKPTSADLGRTHRWDPGYWLILCLKKKGLAWDIQQFPRSAGAAT